MIVEMLYQVRPSAMLSVPGWKWNNIARELDRLQRREYDLVHPSPDEPTPIFDSVVDEFWPLLKAPAPPLSPRWAAMLGKDIG